MLKPSIHLNKMNAERVLRKDIAGFYADPLGYVRYNYKWSEGELSSSDGPDKWQADLLAYLGQRVRENMERVDQGERAKPIRIAVASGHGIGKAQSLGTIVDTPDGERCWGDLKVDDCVFGADGRPTKIKATKLFKAAPMYRVTFDDGSSTVVSSGHLWAVRGRQDRRNKRPGYQALETIDILKRGVKRPNGKTQTRQWEIPVQNAVHYIPSEQKVHPYFMGIWLGDGKRGVQEYCKPYPEIAKRIRRVCGYELSYTDHKTRVLGKTKDFVSDPIFKKYSHQRYIPDIYKYASVEQRVELFRGLCDSDGEVNGSGSVGYSTSSEKLAHDVVWLARSLGLKAMLQPTVKKPFYTVDGKKCQGRDNYRITINCDFNPFTIEHRKQRFKLSESRYQKRWIDRIDFVGHKGAMCIEVEAADGLYQTNDFIVTHNSAITAWIGNWIMDTRPNSHGTVTANTSAQLETKTWAEIAKWRKRGLTNHWFKVSTGRGSMKMASHANPENWFCSAQTCREENSESFAGQHALGGTSFYLFDEASAVPATIWEVAEGGLLSSDEAIHIVFGNPTQNTGKFRECFGSDRHRWKIFQIDSRTAKLPNKEEIKEWEDTYGEDSDFFRVRVRGVFPRASAMQFIPSDIVEAALGKVIPPHVYIHHKKIMGVDIARSGEDMTVLIRRRGLAAYNIEKFRNLKSQVVAGKIAEAIKHEKLDHVFLDMGNTGAAIYDMLVDWSYGDVVTGVWFAAESSEISCENKRIEMYFRIREWLNLGGSIPNDRELRDDLINPEYYYNTKEKMLLEAGKDMKKRGLPSPDCGFALGLTFAYPVPEVSKHAVDRSKAKTQYDLFDESKRQPQQVKARTDYDLFG